MFPRSARSSRHSISGESTSPTPRKRSLAVATAKYSSRTAETCPKSRQAFYVPMFLVCSLRQLVESDSFYAEPLGKLLPFSPTHRTYSPHDSLSRTTHEFSLERPARKSV